LALSACVGSGSSGAGTGPGGQDNNNLGNTGYRHLLPSEAPAHAASAQSDLPMSGRAGTLSACSTSTFLVRATYPESYFHMDLDEAFIDPFK
jgi:hypothetical protein